MVEYGRREMCEVASASNTRSEILETWQGRIVSSLEWLVVCALGYQKLGAKHIAHENVLATHGQVTIKCLILLTQSISKTKVPSKHPLIAEKPSAQIDTKQTSTIPIQCPSLLKQS
jgi:hypothetical protein